MSGLPWIKVWTLVARHPKVQRLEKETGLRDALGHVIRLWCWTADFAPDGYISHEQADAMLTFSRAGTPVAKQKLCHGFVTAGMLDPVPTGYRVHDWHDMQTTHVDAEEKKKLQARERQAKHRARNAQVTRDVTRDVTQHETRDSVTQIEIEKEIETDRAVSLNSRSSIPSLGVVRGEA